MTISQITELLLDEMERIDRDRRAAGVFGFHEVPDDHQRERKRRLLRKTLNSLGGVGK